MRLPRWPMALQPATAVSLAQPAAGEALGAVGATDRISMLGQVYWADGQDHDCAIVHHRTGSATSPLLTMRVGFRDIDLANGPSGRDDGSVDQFGTHVNPTANTNYSTTLSAVRAIAHGSRQCLVWDLSAYTSGSIRTPAGLTAQATAHSAALTFFNGTTYAQVAGAQLPLVTLEADDGTFGCFVPGVPLFTASPASVTFASDDNPDERALAFSLAAAATVINFGWFVTTVAGGDFDLVLYEGTTVKGTLTIDANTWGANAVARWVEGSFAGDFQPGTYRLALKPTTTTDVTFSTVALTAGHLSAFGPHLLGYSTRVDGGAWSAPDDTVLPALAWVDVIPAAGGGSGGATTLLGGALVR